MKNNKILKRFLAFLLTAAMTLTYMPMAASWFAYAGDGDNDQVQLEQQVKAETSTGSEESSAAKGPSKEEVATDQTIESVEDAAESKESKTSEDTSEEVNGAASEKVEEASDKAKEEASDKAKEEASDKAQEEAAEQVEETAEDEAAEAVAGELTAVEEGSYKITVKYDESAGIPEGAELEVKEIKSGGLKFWNYNRKAKKAVNGTDEKKNKEITTDVENGDPGLLTIISGLHETSDNSDDLNRFFDISIVVDGKEIEPNDSVGVTIEYDDIDLAKGEKLEVVHFADSGTEVIQPKLLDNKVVFEQNSFSVTGTVVTSLSNNGRYALLVDHDGKKYEVMFDGTLQEVAPVPDTTDQYTVSMAETWQWQNAGGGNYSLRVTKASGSEFIDPTADTGLGSTQRNIRRNSVGNSGYTISNSNTYLGITTDSTSGQPVLSGGNSVDDAAVFYFAQVARTTAGRTVDHIDIGVEAKASVSVPLAYGIYYDSEGNEIENVPVGQHKNATGVNEAIPISEEDLMSANISSYTMDGTERVPDNSFIIDQYTSSTQAGEIDQVRVGGTFPVGWVELSGNGSRGNIEQYITDQNQVYYEVDVRKPVELTLKKKVGDDMVDLYQKDADGNLVQLKVTVNVNLVSNFCFWDDDNECPGINNQGGQWWDPVPGCYTQGGTGRNATSSLSPAGMDFRLGTTDETDADLGAIEIIKYVVDEKGNQIALQSDVDYTFDIFNDEDGDVTAPAAWSGETTATIDRSGYTDLADRKVTVSASSGMGVSYDYSVDQGLVYVAEKTPVQTITDANGKILKYKETRIETEYAWRNDDGQMHSNIKQDDKLIAIPDVVGDYYSTTYEGELHNTFLEFYVYNVYAPETGNLKVSKEVSGAEAATGKDYKFTVKQSSGDNYVQADGSLGATAYEFTVKGGSDITINNIPIGDYTVTEITASAEIEGYTLVATGGGSVTIKTDETAASTLTNTYTLKTGNLKVSKEVSGAEAATGKDYKFTVKQSSGDNYVQADGSLGATAYEFTVKGGSDITINNIPIGDYTVTEITASAEIEGYTLVATGGGSVTIKTDETAASTLTNTYTLKTGNLKVSKEVSGAEAATGKDYKFTVKQSSGDNYVQADGSLGATAYEFTVKGGSDITINNIPIGDYTVTEITASAEIEGYTLVATGGGSVTIKTDETAASTLTNTYELITTEASVKKVWDDNNNADGKRPESLKVTLSNGDEVTLNEENGWSAKVENLPKYKDGKEINYTWSESSLPEGYTLVSSTKDGTVTTLTNKYTAPDKGVASINPPVQKIIEGKAPKKAETYTFKLEATNPSNPMPKAAGGSSSMTMNIKGEGIKEFGKIEFTEPGVYAYIVSEVMGDNEDCEYDDTIYTVIATVTEGSDGKLQVTREYKKDGASVSTATFQFVNTYDGEDESSGAKTGDDSGIMGLLALMSASAAGLAALCVRRRREEQ